MKLNLIIFTLMMTLISPCWSFELVNCNHINLSIIYRVDQDSGDINEIIKFDKSFNSILPLIKYFSLPAVSKVTLDKSSERRNASVESNSLYIGLKNYNFNYESNPVLVHEFGHLIFNHQQNLEKLFPKDKIKDIKKKINFSPYDEFFSDLLTVLTTRDGQSIYFTMYDHAVERDFTKNGNDLFKVDEEKLMFKDDHHYFNKTRKLIWEYFEKSGKSPEAAAKIIQKTYQIIGKSITDRYTAGENQENTISTQEEIDKIESQLYSNIKSVLND